MPSRLYITYNWPPVKLSETFLSDISFETPVIPKAFHILETYNPGSVIRILAFDGNDTDTDANYKGTR